MIMSLTLESPSAEELCIALGKSEDLLNELEDKLEDWLKLQPHLPQNVPRELLEYLLIGTKMSLEQAKHKLDMFFTIRNLVPELYTSRDPRDAGLMRLHGMMQIVYLPKLTPENDRVCIFRPYVDDYSKFDSLDGLKYSLMIEEILITESRSRGLVYIADQSMVTLGLLAKYTPTAVKKAEVTLTAAYAKRIKGIHLINAAPLTEHLVTLLKKIFKQKIAARIHAYPRGNYESLYQHVPKSILPKDYGGDEPSMDYLAEQWRQKVDGKRDWFLEQEKVVVDERLRPGPGYDADNLFGFSGSFRKLDVD